MSGFLKSPLIAMSQLGGCDDGGGGDYIWRICSAGASTDIGEAIWTPSPDIQSVLDNLSADDRRAVLLGVRNLQEIFATALTTYIATPGYIQADAILAVVNRLLDNMSVNEPSD